MSKHPGFGDRLVIVWQSFGYRRLAIHLTNSPIPFTRLIRRAYLAQMGMEPEWDEDGEFYDWDPEKCQPLFDPEHVFCRMMGNDWMDVTKLRQQRHLKHYKGIEFDKESGEFFDFDSVTKEELAEIIEAGGLEVSFFSCLYGQLV